MKNLRRSQRGNGFTLVELLVVIAIITVLIALLLPSLGRARDQAKSVRCKANLKGIAVGMLAYSSEYDGQMIPGYCPGHFDASGSGFWYTNLLVDNGYVPNTGWRYGSSEAWGEIRTGVWLCPSAMNLQYGGGYAVNIGQYVIPPGTVVYPGLCVQVGNVPQPKLSSLGASADYWLIGDAWNQANTAAGPDATIPYIMYATYNERPSSRHMGTFTNVAFADGHADSIKWTDYTGNTAAMQHMFFVPGHQ